MLANKTAYILLAILLAVQATACTAEPTVDSTMKKVQNILIANSGSESARLHQAAAILTEGLQSHPENSQLLRLRANMYADLHDYKRSMSDLKLASSVKPLPRTIELFLCMLIDRVGKSSMEAKECYSQVVHEFESTKTPDVPPSANHVIAALLAGTKNAAHLKEKYLSSHSPTNPTYSVVQHFNRQKYIHTILP